MSEKAVTNWMTNIGIIGLDVRAIGCFRFLLGVYLLYELVFCKLGSISYFYLPNGLFDLEAHQQSVPNGYSIFDYLLLDWQVYVFFGTTFLAYFLYTIGYKAQLFAAISYFCLWNIQQRTGMSFGWEGYANVLLFWSIFLPIGKTFNIAHFLQPSKKLESIVRYEYKGVAAYAIILQIGLIYLVTFLLKTGDFWLNGHAITAVLSDAMIRKPAANLLLPFTNLCIVANYLLLYFELLLCLMLFFPIFNTYFRLVAAISLFIFHWSTYPFLDLGLYALVATCVSVLLLPSSVWNILSEKFNFTFANVNVGEIKRQKWLGEKVMVVLLLISIIPQNLALLRQKSHISGLLQKKMVSQLIDKTCLPTIGNNSFLRQRWNFFAPDVAHEIGWISLVGQLENGALIDIMTNITPAKAIPHNDFVYPLNFYLMLVRNIRLNPDFYEKNYKKWLKQKVSVWEKQHPKEKLTSIAIGLFSVDAEQAIETGQYSANYRNLYVLAL